jgi:beta-alanine degradation protein BauB
MNTLLNCTAALIIAPLLAQSATAHVEIDNAWVHVTRVDFAPHEKVVPRDFRESVVVYLSDNGSHKDGETAHFPAGSRAEENTTDHPAQEIVVELKPKAPPFPAHPYTRDPVKVDAEHHTVDFQNDRVRVLRTILVPHLKSPLHDHPAYVVVYLTELHTTMAITGGKTVDNPRHKGDVAWRDAMQHATENIGAQTASEIQIELK